MRLIDLLYRAFNAYRQQTENNTNSQKERKVIKQTNIKEDELTSIKHNCIIESDWIENIEEGLIYIEKAIREERQFIRTEGEVVPIEKAKRASKATVAHLARHSGLITRLPEKEGDTLVPDKLYIVEKLSDYAVYENRFLYMLLCYLRDFINIRIDKIRDKMTTYQSNMFMKKEIKLIDRHINYHLSYSDIHKNDPYLMKTYDQIPLIKRIETIHYFVTALLSTPLMNQVSKSPMIKPPIVKTNVLRMNPNFRAALQLYDYITSYTKNGYHFEEIKKTMSPFQDEMSDEIAETIQLTSFLAYKHGNDIKSDLKEVYDNEEEKIKEQENQKTIEQIQRLKKRMVEFEEDPAEYILTLEKRNRILEKDSAELVLEKERNANLNLQIAHIEKEMENLNSNFENTKTELRRKNETINQLNKKYYDDMTVAERIHRQEKSEIIEKTNQKLNSMYETHQQEVANLNEEYRIKIFQINENHQNEFDKAIEQYNAQITELHYSHNNQIEAMQQKHTQDKQELTEFYQVEKVESEKKLNNLKQLIEKLEAKEQELTLHCSELVRNHEAKIDEQKAIYDSKIQKLENNLILQDEEKKYAMAKVLALKQQQGLITETDDFTAKESFKELEMQMVAFKKVFKEQWKKTKVKIRKEIQEAAKANITNQKKQ